METLIKSEEMEVPITEFLKSGNNASSAEAGESTQYTSNSIRVLFAVIMSVCVLINARIIYVMLVNTNRRNR